MVLDSPAILIESQQLFEFRLEDPLVSSLLSSMLRELSLA